MSGGGRMRRIGGFPASTMKVGMKRGILSGVIVFVIIQAQIARCPLTCSHLRPAERVWGTDREREDGK